MENHCPIKKALVTGASRGIGKGIALALAQEGYDVAITYSTQKEDAEEVANVIENKFGRQCIVFQASLEKEEVPFQIVEQSIKALGHIDVLVNNAGLTRIQYIDRLELEMLNFLINLNYKSYILAIRAVSQHMIENNIKGSIVNITSSRGQRAYPGDAIYGGLKAAIARGTQSIALDLAPYGIRVNCVAPGATAVRFSDASHKWYDDLGPRIPLGRVGMPSDVANAVVWLASDKASYITGETIRVDGGLILPGMPESRSDDTDQGWGYVWKRRD